MQANDDPNVMVLNESLARYNANRIIPMDSSTLDAHLQTDHFAAPQHLISNKNACRHFVPCAKCVKNRILDPFDANPDFYVCCKGGDLTFKDLQTLQPTYRLVEFPRFFTRFLLEKPSK